MIIYVLKLQQGKYYVGKTNNPVKRLEDHQNGLGSAWTKTYKVEKVEEIMDIDTDTGKYFIELGVTLHYMKLYGIENVRGADYCRIHLPKEQRIEIQRHICAEENKCYKCKRSGHFVTDCPPVSLCEKVRNMFTMFIDLFKTKDKKEYSLLSSGIVGFGKHKGCTFEYVEKKYPDYCQWVLNQQSKHKPFQEFQQWIKTR